MPDCYEYRNIGFLKRYSHSKESRKGVDFFKAKMFHFLQNDRLWRWGNRNRRWKGRWFKFEHKKENFPWILTIAYEFDDVKVLEKGNKFKCKACGNNIPVSSVKSGNRKSKKSTKKRLNLFPQSASVHKFINSSYIRTVGYVVPH